MAADRGNLEAMLTLDKFYHSGTGVQKNIKEAFYWYERSSAYGNRFAQHHLGIQYEIGNNGIKQDYRLAYKWFKMASVNGLEQSQEKLKEIGAKLPENEIEDLNNSAEDWLKEHGSHWYLDFP